MQNAQALPAIEVEDVGKTYHLWGSPGARLWVPLLYRAAGQLRRLHARPLQRLAARLEAAAQRRLHTHTALHAVNLRLLPGESLGIIGLNGSGKSTLLQIIAGVLPASTGRVAVRGRVAALLELGSGFNPDLSGRENVYVNAAILGFARARVDALIGEIIAFAGIGEYIDEPVRTYSSGMLLRLAFAVQVHVEPDVLIVDEALAVGDAQFQAKAMARIEQILARGTTLLFVGHDLNALRMFCQRAMLLEGGRIVREGLPEDVIADYLRRAHAPLRELAATPLSTAGASPPADSARSAANDTRSRFLAVSLADGAREIELAYAGALTVCVEFTLGEDLAQPVLIVDVLDLKGLQVSGRRLPLTRDPGRYTLALHVEMALQAGDYRLRLRLVDTIATKAVLHARIDAGIRIRVNAGKQAEFTGLFALPMAVQAEVVAEHP